jgi:CRISPR-associated protein Cas2
MRHILVTYDVRTDERAGQRRLRKVAKICESYGQRVQKSVFECQIDDTTFEKFEHKLLSAIDREEDSLRIYWIARPFETNVRQYGQGRSIDFSEPLVL